MTKIVVAGLSVCDILLKPVDRDVFDLDSVYPEMIKIQTGGDALNVSINLTKLGMGEDLSMVAAVGSDMFGDFVVKSLKERCVDTHHVKRLNTHQTATSFVLIESSGERHFVCEPGANQALCVEDILPAIGADTQYLHLSSLMCLPQLEDDAHRRLFEYAKARGIHTSFDLTSSSDGVWLEKIRKGLKFTDTLFMSEDEAVHCFGQQGSPMEMARFFHDLGAKEFVLKLGDKGCFAMDFDQEAFHMDAYRSHPVVDTTGAGDAFVSAFLFGKINGLSLRESAVLGNANGILATGKVGANNGTATLEEMIRFIAKSGTNGITDETRLLNKLSGLRSSLVLRENTID